MNSKETLRVGNLLGALAIGISDRLITAMMQAVGHAGETAAALIQVGTTPGLTIRELSEALALSHSAVVRLTSRLAQLGYIARRTGRDRREVSHILTASGKTAMRQMLRQRSKILAAAISDFDADDLERFGRYLALILNRLPRDMGEAVHICRYCDEDACPQDRCPVFPAA